MKLNGYIKRPAFRYFGGKFKIAPWVISHFPNNKTYVDTYNEPFGGAGSCLLLKEPSKNEVYNDLNSEVVNLFRVLRDPESASMLLSLLDLTPYSREEWEDCHEFCFDRPVEQARRTVVMFAMTYNPSKAMLRKYTGWRSHTSADHRMPLHFQNYCEALKMITKRLKQVTIENRPADKVSLQHDSLRTLHYLDPPYLDKTRSTQRGDTYSNECLTVQDHIDIAIWAHKLKGFVIISHYDCQEYRELYDMHGWVRKEKKAYTSAGKKVTECIWLNPYCASISKQLNIFQ